MAFWFFLSVGGYILIWLITGDLDAMPSSVLALIGISATTALGATAIDYSKSQSDATESTSLATEAQSLAVRLAQLKAGQSLSADEQRELADKVARYDLVNQRLQALREKAGSVGSRGFLNDILTDGGSVSLHRFQIVVWTLVLGLVFCDGVYKNLAMPAFNNTLLALMGISAGTYLGLNYQKARRPRS
jgi:hypothetical protein